MSGGSDGERESFTVLIDSLLDTYRPEGVVIWLHSYNRALGDSPRNLMAVGDWQLLLDEADRLAAGRAVSGDGRIRRALDGEGS